MQDTASAWTKIPIDWRHTGDGEVPYRADVGGWNLLIRVNDFPDQPLYTLFVDEIKISDLEDWPPAWRRPPIPRHLLDLLAQTKKSKG
jgi:hypothetical protein